MLQLRVVLAVAAVAQLPALPSHAEEALPGPTERMVRLAGEPGTLRHSVEAALGSPLAVEPAAQESSDAAALLQSSQSGPKPFSWYSSWKFYGGLLLIMVAALALAWVF